MKTGSKYKKLTSNQRNALLEWISADLPFKEIKLRACAFKPTFKVTQGQISYYQRTRNLNSEKFLKALEERLAWARGLGIL